MIAVGEVAVRLPAARVGERKHGHRRTLGGRLAYPDDLPQDDDNCRCGQRAYDRCADGAPVGKPRM